VLRAVEPRDPLASYSRALNLQGPVFCDGVRLRQVWRTMTDLTVPLIAAGAVVAGALASQVSTVVNAVITGRRDRTTAQERRRREAYAAFIDATQGILQSLSGLPPTGKASRAPPPAGLWRRWRNSSERGQRS
jgi:hypothetical protein